MTVSSSVTLSSFYFLLLIFLFQLLCGQVYATPEKNNIELFKTGKLSNLLQPDNSNTQTNEITAKDYYSPFIVATDDVIVALTGVNHTSKNADNEKNITIVTKYIEIEKDKTDWVKNILSDSTGVSKNKWKSQLAAQHKLENIAEGTSVVKGMLAIANEKNIYLLLVNCSNKNNGESTNSDGKCDLNIIAGTVSNDKTSGKKITWNDGKINNADKLTEKLKENHSKPYPSGGTGFITAGKKVVFMVLIKDEKKKNTFAAVYLSDDKSSTEFTMSEVQNVDGCNPSFFQWGEKIIMMPTHCSADDKANSKKVKMLNDVEKTLVDSTGHFDRLLDFMQDKKDFTTVKINNISVLLFTQLKPKTTTAGDGQQKQFDVHVWFSDGNRVSTAGRIATDHNITSANMIHTNNELFALHQNISDSKLETITLTRMEDQLKNITTVITAWNNTDRTVLNLFKDIKELSEATCLTDGLVGFLSDSENSSGGDKLWKDEYYFMNATVNGGTKVDYGYKFDGNGKGAKWPVGKKAENQPYNFTDPGFTLVANVTIDVAANTKDNSVLGVVYKENINAQKTIGLRCTTIGEWEVIDNEGSPKRTVTNRINCQQKHTYLVAIILNKSELSVYIDGKVFGETGSEKIKIEKTHNITDFYFGIDYVSGQPPNSAESHVTVTNVLLYNRPLTEDVIKQLKIIKDVKPKQDIDKYTKTQDGSDVPNTQEDKETAGGGTVDKKGTSDQSNDTADDSNNNNSNSGDEETLSSTSEDSSVCGGVVGVLLFLLLLSFCM